MESKLLKRNLEKTLFRFLFLRLRLNQKAVVMFLFTLCANHNPITSMYSRVCKGKPLLEYAYYELIE